MNMHGYDDCVEIKNDTTRVVVSGACGGRLLDYSLNGKNAIYVDDAQDGWTYDPAKETIDPTGGRLDIGPECVIPKHPELWFGKWDTEQTGDLSARMISQENEATGVQLIRDFQLAPDSTELKVTQTIKNISDKTLPWCHWSRTFSHPKGICLIPLTPESRFPKKYIMYRDGAMAYGMDDPNIDVYDDLLVIKGLPANPKLGFDSYDGRLLYATTNDLLFTKTFPTYPDRVYNEMAAITICVYYHEKFCELEPIGPKETIKPGTNATFTETWTLKDYPFPKGPCDEATARKILHA